MITSTGTGRHATNTTIIVALEALGSLFSMDWDSETVGYRHGASHCLSPLHRSLMYVNTRHGGLRARRIDWPGARPPRECTTAADPESRIGGKLQYRKGPIADSRAAGFAAARFCGIQAVRSSKRFALPSSSRRVS
jgi:hypothetical protein